MNDTYRLTAHPRFGFLQITPTPSTEEITKFYADEFYSKYPNFNDSALDVQIRDKEWLDAHRKDMCETMREIFGAPLNGKEILDIGCGWGENLFYFQQEKMACFGFDPVPKAIDHARKRGLTNLVCAGMEKMDVYNGRRFDAVALFNVLEHLSDPVATLVEIREKLLKPKGVLIVDVPNEFNAFQLSGRDVHQLGDWWVSPPAHLNYFSKDTLCKLLTGLGYNVKLTESSFPLEMFLLFGDKYVGNGPVGSECHRRRVSFEMNLRKTGRGAALRQFYRSLAEQNLGRQIICYASKD